MTSDSSSKFTHKEMLEVQAQLHKFKETLHSLARDLHNSLYQSKNHSKEDLHNEVKISNNQVEEIKDQESDSDYFIINT